jgi:hypothetical protein
MDHSNLDDLASVLLRASIIAQTRRTNETHCFLQHRWPYQKDGECMAVDIEIRGTAISLEGSAGEKFGTYELGANIED